MRSLDLKIIKAEKKYFKFIKAQEVLAEPFRDKSSQFKNFYLPISDLIFKNYIKDKKTKIIGLTGGQGSGKSTISIILKIILKEIYKLETVIFSIDDFYKTIKQRRSISKKVSHLFLTRGVPGTHDTKLMMDCFKKLKNKKFKKLLIPKFDKSIDDRLPKKKWQKIKKKPNIIIFEGWCVGATPQKNEELSIPINILETEKDKNNFWRKKVNYELKTSYKKIFNLVDEFIYLKVPSFKHVLKWRLLQEKKLKMRSKGKKIMTDEQIKNFIMYYERITKHMLKNFSSIAKVVIKIDDKHRLKSIKLN